MFKMFFGNNENKETPPLNPRFILNVNDGYHSVSSHIQKETEEKCARTLNQYFKDQQKYFPKFRLHKENHVKYLLSGFEKLRSGFTSLDASKPWLVYWITHSLDLLDSLDTEKYGSRVSRYLSKCQSKNGGFAGGPLQLPHLAPTYAAVNALCIIGTEEAYNVCDRDKMYEFLMSLKDKESGGFFMHDDGELDIRGCYCALSAACLLNLITPDLAKGVTKYVLNCQTYEGGICSYPGCEAHGGYAFCGLGALMILKQAHKLDIDALIHWCVRRQMTYEGGFNGRPNKLVDACYSLWVGGCFPMLNVLLSSLKDKINEKDKKNYNFAAWECPKEQKEIVEEKENEKKQEAKFEKNERTGFLEFKSKEYLFNSQCLQEYILFCSQEKFGLQDKPGKRSDYYHTCYALSGLSIAQNYPSGEKEVLGNQENRLKKVNPIFNVCQEKVLKMIKYFGNRTKI